MMETRRALRLLLLFMLVIATTSAALADSASPVIPNYDRGSTRVLFMIETRGGYASRLQKLTTLPDFVLYGDGTAVWTRYDKTKDLHEVFAARLTPQEVKQELEFILSSGFEKWYDRYDGVTISNLPTTTFTLNFIDHPMKRTVYGLQMALQRGLVPSNFGVLFTHFKDYRNKNEFAFPIERILLFARKLGPAEAHRGYKTLNWGISQVKLANFAQDSDSEYAQKEIDGRNAERVVQRLHNWTLFSTDLSTVIFFKEKKVTYELGYRPLLPHEQ